MNKHAPRAFSLERSRWIFHETALFADIPESVLERHLSSSTITLENRGAIIFNEGDELKEAILLLRGLATLSRSLGETRLVTVALIAPVEPLGVIAAMEGNLMPLTCSAFKECSLLRIPLEEYRALSQAAPSMTSKLMSMAASRFRAVQRRMGEFLTVGAHERVYHALELLLDSPAVRGDGPDEIIATRKQIAELAGVTTETSIRATSTLEKNGVITFPGRGKIAIDRSKLAQFIRDGSVIRDHE